MAAGPPRTHVAERCQNKQRKGECGGFGKKVAFETVSLGREKEFEASGESPAIAVTDRENCHTEDAIKLDGPDTGREKRQVSKTGTRPTTQLFVREGIPARVSAPISKAARIRMFAAKPLLGGDCRAAPASRFRWYDGNRAMISFENFVIQTFKQTTGEGQKLKTTVPVCPK